MKKIISLTGLICATVFAALFVLIPVRAEAATMKTYTEGKVVRTQTQGKVCYEYTVDVDSLIEINYAYNTSDEGGVIFYEDKEMVHDVDVRYFYNESGKVFVALNAGTYYVDIYENYNDRTTKVKMTSTPASQYSQGNYCKAKAISLEKKQWAKAVQTRQYEYSRWYVIKVPKTQKVTIDCASGYMGSIYLFNSKCTKYYYTDFNGRTQTTTNRVPAGTYYIAAHTYNIGTYNQNVGVYYQFRWY